jgi:hypothetical protein
MELGWLEHEAREQRHDSAAFAYFAHAAWIVFLVRVILNLLALRLDVRADPRRSHVGV